MVKKIKKGWLVLIIIVVILVIFVAWSYWVDFGEDKHIEYGINFSQKYASELNLDWQEMYLAALDDLGVKKLRLMAHWDLIEPMKDSYNFSDLDWQLDQAQSRGAEVILVIGHRVPRWPECHWPDWAFQLSEDERQQQILELLTLTVERYKNNSAVIAWQPENEPFLKVFGECPKPDRDFYKKEIELVRSLDSRPIVITESGELSTWRQGAKLADYLGTSVYRVTWNKNWGYFRYHLPPSYYYLKAQLIKLFFPVKEVIVSEMQMEPWLPNSMPITIPLAEQYRSMDIKQFVNNFHYTQKIGLTPIYFWGTEWWYWLKQQGDESIWQAAREIPF